MASVFPLFIPIALDVCSSLITILDWLHTLRPDIQQVKKQQLELDMEKQTGSKLGKEYVKVGCILPPCLFNLYAQYIMRYAELDEAQTGIKIAGRNIINLRYADDTTLMAESEEELKSLVMTVKKLVWNSMFRKLRSWHLVPSLHGK